MQLESA